MKESEIRKRAIEIITKQGGVAWFPSKVRWKKEQDVFGVFDILIIYPPSTFVPIQITTASNMRAREKKILNFYNKFGISIYSEVWGLRKKEKDFKILHIYGDKQK